MSSLPHPQPHTYPHPTPYSQQPISCCVISSVCNSSVQTVGWVSGIDIFAPVLLVHTLAALSAFLWLFILKKLHVIVQVQNLNTARQLIELFILTALFLYWVISSMCFHYINNGRQLLIFPKPLGSMNCSISFTISNRGRCKIATVRGWKQLSKRRRMP